MMADETDETDVIEEEVLVDPEHTDEDEEDLWKTSMREEWEAHKLEMESQRLEIESLKNRLAEEEEDRQKLKQELENLRASSPSSTVETVDPETTETVETVDPVVEEVVIEESKSSEPAKRKRRKTLF